MSHSVWWSTIGQWGVDDIIAFIDTCVLGVVGSKGDLTTSR